MPLLYAICYSGCHYIECARELLPHIFAYAAVTQRHAILRYYAIIYAYYFLRAAILHYYADDYADAIIIAIITLIRHADISGDAVIAMSILHIRY